MLKISLRGTGLDTSYSTLPKPSKVGKVEEKAMTDVADSKVADLLTGDHPFLTPAARYSSASTEEDEICPLNSRGELPTRRWVFCYYSSAKVRTSYP